MQSIIPENKPVIPVTTFADAIGMNQPVIKDASHHYAKNETEVRSNRRYATPQGIQNLLARYDLKPKHPIVISISALKGGVGKTSIATALAVTYSACGFKTLLIDSDKQANSTYQLLDDEYYPKNVLSNFFTGNCELNDLIENVADNLDLIPSSLKNQNLETELNGNNSHPLKFMNNKMFNSLKKDYDVIIVDTDPSLSKFNYFSIACSDINLLVFNNDRFSFDGLQMSVDSIETTERDYGANLNAYALLNKVDQRSIGSAVSSMSDAKDMIGIMKTAIRQDRSFKKFQDTKMFPTGRSKLTDDMVMLAFEIFDKCKKTETVVQ